MKLECFLWLLDELELPLAGRRVLECAAGEGYLVRAQSHRYPTASVTVVEPLWQSAGACERSCHTLVAGADVRHDPSQRAAVDRRTPHGAAAIVKLSSKRRVDHYIGGALASLLKPRAILLGTVLRRNHDCRHREQIVVHKLQVSAQFGSLEALHRVPALRVGDP